MSNDTVAWTPGPWVRDKSDSRSGDVMGRDSHGDLELVASAYPMGEVECACGFGPIRDANAHLIAAAPELYEALDRLMAWAGIPEDFEPAIQARAALAKARGEEATADKGRA